MGPRKIAHVFEDISGRVVEAFVDLAEFLCPPLKEYLSWDFDDTNMLATLDEEDPPRGKPVGAMDFRTPSFKERGVFVHHAAGAA